MANGATALKAWLFWSWFNGEAPRLRNLFAAMHRGEADIADALERLNTRLRRFDPLATADLHMTLDDKVCMTLCGGHVAGLELLLASAPSIPDWRFLLGTKDAEQPRRIPFRLAPQTSADAGWDAGTASRLFAYQCVSGLGGSRQTRPTRTDSICQSTSDGKTEFHLCLACSSPAWA